MNRSATLAGNAERSIKTAEPHQASPSLTRDAPSPSARESCGAGNNNATGDRRKFLRHPTCLSLLVSLVESRDERVRLIGEVERVIEKDCPAANDLADRSTAFALEPLASSRISRDPERQEREIERSGCGVRETHNSLVAAPSGLPQTLDICAERSWAKRRELVRFRIEPDVASADEDRDLLADRRGPHE